MFQDLKEYQDLTRIYNESVNISEEQKEINKLFLEADFTAEEIQYLDENFDELWESEFAILTEESIIESIKQENLTEEQLDEILGLRTGVKLAGKLAKKAAPMLKKGIEFAKKGIKSGKTAIKDTLSGAKTVAKKAIDKAKPILKKVGGVLKKVPGIALPVAAVGGIAAGINKLRNIGKEKRIDKQVDDYVKDRNLPGGPKKIEVKPDPKPVETKVETKPTKMHSIEKKNRARFGDEKVDKLKAKNVDFKKMRSGEMSKADFIKKYPNSITAQKSKGLRDHTEWDAYDMVLEYLFSTEQVTSLEEANYIMMEMDHQTIGEIVKEVKVFLGEAVGSAAGKLMGGLAGKVVGSAGSNAASTGGTAKAGDAAGSKAAPKKSKAGSKAAPTGGTAKGGTASGPKLEEGLAGAAMKLGALAAGAYGVKKGVQKAAEKLGTMHGTPKKPKQGGLIQKLKDRKDATNKAIEQM